MVAVSSFEGVCPKCGGDVSLQIIRPERFACIYCGWRAYADTPLRSSREGRVLRLRYLGESLVLMRFPPLAALMVPEGDPAAQSRLGLRIACPLCREAGMLSVMDRCGRSLERWSCGVGHALMLHRIGREEIVGWS